MPNLDHPILPLIKEEMGVSYFGVGLIMATYSLCSAAFQYPAGERLNSQ